MTNTILERTQKEILALVAAKYSQVYLVGGTAINLLYHHRVSEDLDFFTQAAYRAQLLPPSALNLYHPPR